MLHPYNPPSDAAPRRVGIVIHSLLLIIACLLFAGCAALAELIGPAATVAGSALSAYERTIVEAGKAQGLSPSDPKVLAAIAQARAIAEKRAAEDKARDAAAQAEAKARDVAARADAKARDDAAQAEAKARDAAALAAVIAELRAQARPCASCPPPPPPPVCPPPSVQPVPTVDAGADAASSDGGS